MDVIYPVIMWWLISYDTHKASSLDELQFYSTNKENDYYLSLWRSGNKSLKNVYLWNQSEFELGTAHNQPYLSTVIVLTRAHTHVVIAMVTICCPKQHSKMFWELHILFLSVWNMKYLIFSSLWHTCDFLLEVVLLSLPLNSNICVTKWWKFRFFFSFENLMQAVTEVLIYALVLHLPCMNIISIYSSLFSFMAENSFQGISAVIFEV